MNKESGKILIVDDDESVLLVAKYILSQQFTDVYTLKNPDDIVEFLGKDKIDVALLDMNYTIGKTTGQEGFDLLKYFTDQAPDTRVIMMTAYSDLDIAIKAIKEGADDFIVKPWDNTKFLKIVTTSFNKGPNSQSLNNKRPGSPSINMPKFKDALEVDRIFMFLDIISATSIAEKLGHIKYFELLNDFFDDLAEPIEIHKGEIYQYVGDEVVVSWPLKEGIDNANCIQCFFNIMDTLNGLTEKYMDKYKLIPGFKAGMHCGKVTTGVVGTYKKEIVYTGDVLNTTSRIEGQCNLYKVNLLFSKDLKDKIKPFDGNEFVEMGEINLRGKKSHIALYTCVRK